MPSKRGSKGKKGFGARVMPLLAIVLAVVIVILAVNLRSLSKQNQESTRKANDLSAQLDKRYSVQLRNLSEHPLSLTVTVTSLATGENRPMYQEIPAQESRQIGSGGGWYFGSADINTMKKVKTKKK